MLRHTEHDRSDGYDEVHLETHQLGGEVGESLQLPLGPALLLDDGLALHIAELAEPLPEW